MAQKATQSQWGPHESARVRPGYRTDAKRGTTVPRNRVRKGAVVHSSDPAIFLAGLENLLINNCFYNKKPRLLIITSNAFQKIFAKKIHKPGGCGHFFISLPQKEEWWLGTESNRRHADFQSAALPTELPSRLAKKAELYRPFLPNASLSPNFLRIWPSVCCKVF